MGVKYAGRAGAGLLGVGGLEEQDASGGFSPDGLPIRGSSAYLLKRDELEDLPMVQDFHSHRFDLWIAEEKIAFDKLYDLVCDGGARILVRKDQWNDEHNYPMIWIEWTNVLLEVPENAARRTR